MVTALSGAAPLSSGDEHRATANHSPATRGKHNSLASRSSAAVVVIEPVRICRPKWYNEVVQRAQRSAARTQQRYEITC
jgi:hypothetical protein